MVTTENDERKPVKREFVATLSFEPPKLSTVLTVAAIIAAAFFFAYYKPASSDSGLSVFSPETCGRIEINVKVAEILPNERFNAAEQFGGFQWTLQVYRKNIDGEHGIAVYLYSEPTIPSAGWAVDFDSTISLVSQEGNDQFRQLGVLTINKTVSNWGYNSMVPWSHIMEAKKGYVKDGLITLQAYVKILRAANVRIPLVPSFDKFVPGQTDACLSVEGKKFYVSRSLLSLHSSYFANLFSTHQAKDAHACIAVSNVQAAEFKDLLTVIYAPERLEKMRDLEGLLRAAKEFGVESVLSRCASLLLQKESDLNLASRLRLASKYNLQEANVIINQISKAEDIKNLEKSEEWKEITAATRAALLTRVLELQ